MLTQQGFRGAIFDVDGVLVDSPHERAWRDTLHELMETQWRDIRSSCTYAPDRFTSRVYQDVVSGRPRLSGARAVLEYFHVPDTEARAIVYAECKQDRVLHLIRAGEFRAFPDALRFVLALSGRGLAIAAASSSRNAGLMLEQIRVEPSNRRLSEFFAADLSGQHFARGKPAPDIFVAACASLGLSPAECFVVEDAAVGIEAAKAGGLAALGIARADDAELLTTAGADLVVTTLDDVDLDRLTDRRLVSSPAGSAETMRPDLDVLLDPVSSLRAQGAEYAWADCESLRLDERYRARQLPLLHARPRPPIAPETVAPGEFWPPVRSVVIPLPDDLLEDETMVAFLDELRASDVAPMVWFEGLAVRAGKMHATLVPGLSTGEVDEGPVVPDGPTDGRAVQVVVTGPWIGRFNTGRIYLPVRAADEQSAITLRGVRSRYGAENRPLLAGFLQLHDDVHGELYVRLRDILTRHRERIAIPVSIVGLTVTETMDDLVLRSRELARMPLSVRL